MNAIEEHPVRGDIEASTSRCGQNGSITPLVAVESDANYKLQIFQSSMNVLAHVFIGICVGVSMLFSFRNGLPLSVIDLHIMLTVIGYQLLMAEGILSLSPSNGWSARLRAVDKKRAHWILQILGSVLAIAGSAIIIMERNVHWGSLHGQFALVALVFTVASLINGVTSLYTYELRGLLNGQLSKITHIIFGIVAFGAATISLCYGFEKRSFVNWATADLAYFIIAITAGFTFIIIIDPFIIFYKKSKVFVNRN